jgi:hypothetical protein
LTPDFATGIGCRVPQALSPKAMAIKPIDKNVRILIA